MPGPHSVNFPERVAARMIQEGILRLDPQDWSVWRVRRLRPDGLTAVIPNPKRIDYAHKRGHRSFHITVSPGKRSAVVLARLIWQVTHGDIPDRMTVNHKDGNPANETPDNYELATQSEQHLHRFRVLGHGAPQKVNKDLLDQLAKAARTALETGDHEPLRAALKAYDELVASFGHPHGIGT